MTFNACGCVFSGNESSPNAYPSTFTGKAVLVRKRTGWRGSTASQFGQHEEANESVANAKAIARYLGGHVIVDNCLAAAEEEIAFNACRVEDATTVAEQAVTFDQSVGGIFDARLAQRTSGQTLVAFDPPDGTLPKRISPRVCACSKNARRAWRPHAPCVEQHLSCARQHRRRTRTPWKRIGAV